MNLFLRKGIRSKGNFGKFLINASFLGGVSIYVFMFPQESFFSLSKSELGGMRAFLRIEKHFTF